MILGTRLWGGKKMPTARDYVQDGLVLQIDGIENLAYGEGDDSTVIRNLVNGDTAENYRYSRITNGWRLYDDRNACIAFPQIANASTIEFVGEVLKYEFVAPVQPSSGSGFKLCLNKDGAGNFIIPNYYATSGSTGKVFPCPYGGTHAISFLSAACYIDGASVAGQTGSTIRGWGYNYTSCTIGYKPNNFVDQGKTLDGYVYAVRIYSRKLTAEEVAANYAIDRARFNLA